MAICYSHKQKVNFIVFALIVVKVHFDKYLSILREKKNNVQQEEYCAKVWINVTSNLISYIIM